MAGHGPWGVHARAAGWYCSGAAPSLSQRPCGDWVGREAPRSVMAHNHGAAGLRQRVVTSTEKRGWRAGRWIVALAVLVSLALSSVPLEPTSLAAEPPELAEDGTDAVEEAALSSS